MAKYQEHIYMTFGSKKGPRDKALRSKDFSHLELLEFIEIPFYSPSILCYDYKNNNGNNNNNNKGELVG